MRGHHTDDYINELSRKTQTLPPLPLFLFSFLSSSIFTLLIENTLDRLLVTLRGFFLLFYFKALISSLIDGSGVNHAHTRCFCIRNHVRVYNTGKLRCSRALVCVYGTFPLPTPPLVPSPIMSLLVPLF